MKKILLFSFATVLILLIAIIYFARSSSGFKSIYFVPNDAVAVIEMKDPMQTWDKIVHSKAWNHYRTNAYFKALNEDIQSYDSLINSNKLLLKLIGKKSITLSIHALGNDKYEYIYIVDVGKIARYKNPEKIINTVLGSEFEVTSREYKDAKIIEFFDCEATDNYFVAFANGKLIFSFEPKLVEKAIDASIDKAIGRDRKFLDVQAKISNKGLLSVYFNYKNLSNIVKSLSPDATESYMHNTRYLCYTGLSFNIDKEGMLTLEGYVSMNDSTPSTYLGMLVNGSNQVESAEIIPLRVASMMKINMNDAEDFFTNTMLSVSDETYTAYVDNMKALEKKLKIDLSDNLFSIMSDEIVLLQTQPSNLGRSNELAVVLHISDSLKTAENLQLIWRQIKKNTPVKIKSVNYKGYKIDYVAFPGIIQALFGNTIKNLQKPYITVINNNLVFSNHPQTLKNIIDDYLIQHTLNTSVDYYNFIKQFDNKTSTSLYFEPPVLFQNLKSFFDAHGWQEINKNKQYITCFKQGAMQINKSDELLHFVLKAQYKLEAKEWKTPYYDAKVIYSMFNNEDEINEIAVTDTLPKILISDLDAKKQEVYYDDGTLKWVVELKDGLKHGKIRGYHMNGEMSLKGAYDHHQPTGKWKYYNEDGKMIKTDHYTNLS